MTPWAAASSEPAKLAAPPWGTLRPCLATARLLRQARDIRTVHHQRPGHATQNVQFGRSSDTAPTTAYRAERRYGGCGPAPQLRGEAERKLLSDDPAILTFSDLLPAALRIMRAPLIGDLLARHWSLLVCDEFQDTDQQQWQLLELLTAPGNRMLLLADPNQMIYDQLPGRRGTGALRLQAALARPGAQKLALQLGSYRDPTQLLPTVAEAVRQRHFDHPAIAQAIADQRLRILAGVDDDPPIDVVCGELRSAWERGARNVGVFMHGNEPTASLSAQLTVRGIDHVPIGISESYGEALTSIAAMLSYAEGTSGWDDVLLRLGVFLTSAVRSPTPPPLARMIATGAVTGGLAARLDGIRLALRDASDIAAAADVAAHSWPSLSRSGERAWRRASAEARLLTRLSADLDDPVRAIIRRVEAARAESFTEVDAGDTAPVQVMNLHQTTGRQARSSSPSAAGTITAEMPSPSPRPAGSCMWRSLAHASRLPGSCPASPTHSSPHSWRSSDEHCAASSISPPWRSTRPIVRAQHRA